MWGIDGIRELHRHWALLEPLPAEPYVYAEWKQCASGSITTSRSTSTSTRCARNDVGTDHGAHRRSVPPRSARCRARAVVIESQARDGARSHAVEPPALRRLDAGADYAAGRCDRPQDFGAGRDHLASARTPSRARLRRHHAPSRATGPSGWRPPAVGRERSARDPTARSIRS
jgi:hypothetical protein